MEFSVANVSSRMELHETAFKIISYAILDVDPSTSC